jgi:hypothetical protein
MVPNWTAHAKCRPRNRPTLGRRCISQRARQFYAAARVALFQSRAGRGTIGSRKETDRVAALSVPCNSRCRHRDRIAALAPKPNPVPCGRRKPELPQGYSPTRSKSILDRGTDVVRAYKADNSCPVDRPPRPLADVIHDLRRVVRLRKILTDLEQSEARAEALIRQGPPFPVGSDGTKGGGR